jgi:1-acyl-sn-glycerol-3-phosphate acyltransferase
MFFKVIYCLFMPVFRLLYRVKISGRENIPNGACVVCANHTSNLDPIFLAIALGLSQNWIFMAKAELFKIPGLNLIIKWLGAIPVNRGSTDISTLRNAIEGLGEGKKVMIFPEGTRVHGEADVSGAKTGAAMIASRAKAPMLPVYISGEKHLFGKVNVVIGEAVSSDIEEKGSAKYRVLVDKVFGEIISLGKGGAC